MWLKPQVRYNCFLPCGRVHYGLSLETARKLLLDAGVPEGSIRVYKTSDFYTREIKGQ